MNRREAKIVEDAKAFGAFDDIYAQGATPDQVKDEVIRVFAPYVNQQSLQKYAVSVLVADAISLRSISTNHHAMGLFREALRIHGAAIQADRAQGLQALAAHNEHIAAGLSTFWSEYHTTRSVDLLEAEEFAHECLRKIGAVIEGPMKPHLRALAQHCRIARGEHVTVAEMGRLTLGQYVAEVIRSSPEPDLFSVRGVPLNQWRNIAQHFAVAVEGQDIVCEYGTRSQEVRLTRTEFEAVVVDVVSAFKALKVAHVVAFVDHLEEMQIGGLLTPAAIRSETSLIVLISALASQGFEVVETHFGPNESRMVVRDLSHLDPTARRLHSTQFVIPLFRERPSDRVTVEYRERDGTPSLRTTATRELLEEAEQTENWHLVAEKCTLTNLTK